MGMLIQRQKAGLELVSSNNPPASDSQSFGIGGVSHRAQPDDVFNLSKKVVLEDDWVKKECLCQLVCNIKKECLC